MFRAVFVAAFALLMAGCVTVNNNLSPQQVATFRLTEVDVNYAPDAVIWWGDGEREFAATRGVAPHDSDKLAKTPEAIAYVRARLTEKIHDAVQRNLAGYLVGHTPVRVHVLVRAVHISSPIQRILVGGGHFVKGDVTVVDARTGQPLLTYPNLIGSVMAGQGVLGAMVEHAVADKPVDRITESFGLGYRKWLLRQ